MGQKYRSFTFEFAIHKQPIDDLIATGKIVAVTVDAETEQPVRVPDELREAVARFEGDPEGTGTANKTYSP